LRALYLALLHRFCVLLGLLAHLLQLRHKYSKRLFEPQRLLNCN
jgi:hypothetical protein